MDNLAQLQSYSSELATAITSLAGYSRTANIQQGSSDQSPFDPEEVQRAKGNILSIVAKIKTLVYGPTDFLQHLASQNEILACLRWLGEFQILACIPLVGSVPIKDIADLTGVPETHLGRIIRLTATAGFLHEPQPSHVAHTHLSASFFSNPSFLDAAMFLSESAAPAALQMAQATQRFGDSHQPDESAYNLALPTAKQFHAARERRPKLNRQWSAYLHHAGGLHTADEVADILTQLNWPKVSNGPDACIIEVDVQSLSTSIARCLADLYPALRFIVQINDPATAIAGDREPEEFNPRITVTTRALGTRQTAASAAVYILHLPLSSPSAVLTELAVHLDVLRARSGIMLILTARLLPEPGSLPDPEVEAMARSRDLALLQLANESEMEMVKLVEMIDTVRDSMGKLVVTNRLRSRNNLVVALVVKYQPDLPRP